MIFPLFPKIESRRILKFKFIGFVCIGCSRTRKDLITYQLKRLLSKLKLRQFYTDNGSDNANDDYGENENSKSNKLSILLKKKKQESANSNYLDFLLNSYKQNDEGREIQRSSLFNENYDYDSQSLSERFRFLYEDDSDISLAAKQSQQLERSLRRFLSKLDKF